MISKQLKDLFVFNLENKLENLKNTKIMKKSIIIALVFVVSAGLSNQLFAQETMEVSKTRTKSNQSNEKSSVESKVVCIGKARCADGTCSITFEQEIVSPRDAASGLPTGKRQHKPFTITKELDQNSSTLTRESPTKASSAKVSYSDLSIVVSGKGKSRSLPVVNGRFTMPDDCDDQDCDLVVSWSWGESNSGSSTKRYQATLNLNVENGVYSASKHTKTGHVSLLK